MCTRPQAPIFRFLIRPQGRRFSLRPHGGGLQQERDSHDERYVKTEAGTTQDTLARDAEDFGGFRWTRQYPAQPAAMGAVGIRSQSCGFRQITEIIETVRKSCALADPHANQMAPGGGQ
jgi:hypothetical protein